jgi:hypothetical protein
MPQTMPLHRLLPCAAIDVRLHRIVIGNALRDALMPERHAPCDTRGNRGNRSFEIEVDPGLLAARFAQSDDVRRRDEPACRTRRSFARLLRAPSSASDQSG